MRHGIKYTLISVQASYVDIMHQWSTSLGDDIVILYIINPLVFFIHQWENVRST